MNRGNNYTVQQVLQRLQTDQLDDSCDENEETELQDKEFVPNCCAGVESCDSVYSETHYQPLKER